MNLLEATEVLIDCAKTYGPEQDRVLRRAVKRMEKRLDVLKLRSAKALRRRQQKGWKTLQFLQPDCVFCGCKFIFGDFIKTAELNGCGNVLMFACPDCDVPALLLLTDGTCQTYYTGEQHKKRTERIEHSEAMNKTIAEKFHTAMP